MIRIEIKGEVASVYGPFPMEFLKIVSRLSGRKAWFGSKSVNIEASPSNIKVLKESGFDFEWEDKTGVLRELHELEMMATQHTVAKVIQTEYKPKIPYLKHMDHCLALSWDRQAYAFLLEMGLCKTSITIHNFGILFKKGEITGVLIYAPKGVHRQWVMEQIPEHLDPTIPLNMTMWENGSEYEKSELFVAGKLNVFVMNTDSIRTEKGREAAALFVRLHKGKVFMALDESHDFKNYSSTRTQEIMKIGVYTKYRRILTGTPVSKSLKDLWSQFMFLDPRIIGINYLSVFKTRFCEMGGFGYKEVVGSKNIEEFYHLIAPHSYRLTKSEATDLPPKMYMRHEYEMDEKTQKHYDNLRHSYMTDIEAGTIDAKTALDCIMKLQQLLAGYITIDSKTKTVERISEQRTDIVIDMLQQINGQCIVWTPWVADLKYLKEKIEAKLKEPVAGLDNVKEYKTRKARIVVLNQSSGGTGLNLQFKTAGDNNAIYNGNTTRSIHRWQSEDRIWRVGMGGTACIWDIIAYKTVDQKTLDVLKQNKDFADLVLDDIRRIIAG